MPDVTPKQPILIDLFCGRGGWTVPAMSRGWKCHGFDCVDHGYPGELHLGNLPVDLQVLTDLQPDLVLASPPCEEYARHHMPWIKGPAPDESLLRWSIGLIGRMKCPVIVECSLFAYRHVQGGRIAGSYSLWGNVPALLPKVPRNKHRHSSAARRAVIEPSLAEWIMHVMTAGWERTL